MRHFVLLLCLIGFAECACPLGTFSYIASWENCGNVCPLGKFMNISRVNALSQRCGASKSTTCRTWASSTWTGASSNTIDGDTSTEFSTNYDNQNSAAIQYWGIDLEVIQSITNIIFFDGNVYLQRTFENNFKVYVGNHDLTGSSTFYTHIDNVLCYQDNTMVANRFPVTFACNQLGRYVYIVSSYVNTPFHFSEVILVHPDPCYSCGSGTYNSNIASSACMLCNAGQYSTGIEQISSCTLSCGITTYSNAGSSTCSICPVGTYSSMTGTGICNPCAAGKYSNDTGVSVCNSFCLAGTFSDPGSISCTMCTPGNYSGITSATTCYSCPEGSYSTGMGETMCISCPMGSSSIENSTDCYICPIGTYASGMGTYTCMSCKPGYYNTKSNSTFCYQCSMGQYSDANGTSCLTCVMGSYSSYPVSACIQCAAGSFNYLSGATFCIACPLGYYSSVAGQYIWQSFLLTSSCGDGTQKCTTTASSMANGTTPDMVINNNFTDYFTTGPGRNQYWMIDFGTNQNIRVVILFDRFDGKRGQEDGFELWASTNLLPLNTDFDASYNSNRKYIDTSYAAQRFPLVIPLSSYGRYLYVVSKSPLGLHFTEIQIDRYGYTCLACPSKTFGYTTGQSTCSSCPMGTFGQTEVMKATAISVWCPVDYNFNHPITSADAKPCTYYQNPVMSDNYWWVKDLQNSQMVNSVILKDIDGCLTSSTEIYIGDHLDGKATYSFSPLNQKCDIDPIYLTLGCPVTILCKLQGRYIYIVKDSPPKPIQNVSNDTIAYHYYWWMTNLTSVQQVQTITIFFYQPCLDNNTEIYIGNYLETTDDYSFNYKNHKCVVDVNTCSFPVTIQCIAKGQYIYTVRKTMGQKSVVSAYQNASLPSTWTLLAKLVNPEEASNIYYTIQVDFWSFYTPTGKGVMSFEFAFTLLTPEFINVLSHQATEFAITSSITQSTYSYSGVSSLFHYETTPNHVKLMTLTLSVSKYIPLPQVTSILCMSPTSNIITNPYAVLTNTNEVHGYANNNSCLQVLFNTQRPMILNTVSYTWSLYVEVLNPKETYQAGDSILFGFTSVNTPSGQYVKSFSFYFDLVANDYTQLGYHDSKYAMNVLADHTSYSFVGTLNPWTPPPVQLMTLSVHVKNYIPLMQVVTVLCMSTTSKLVLDDNTFTHSIQGDLDNQTGCLQVVFDRRIPPPNVPLPPTTWSLDVEMINSMNTYRSDDIITLVFRSVNIHTTNYLSYFLFRLLLLADDFVTFSLDEIQTYFHLKYKYYEKGNTYSFMGTQEQAVTMQLWVRDSTLVNGTWILNNKTLQNVSGVLVEDPTLFNFSVDLFLLKLKVKPNLPFAGLVTLFCIESDTDLVSDSIQHLNGYVKQIKGSRNVRGYVNDSQGCLRVLFDPVLQPDQNMVAVQNTCPLCLAGTYNDKIRQFSCQNCQICPTTKYQSAICKVGEIKDVSRCTPITLTCADGNYSIRQPVLGDVYTIGSDRECKECEHITGMFIVAGCFNNEAPVYQNCSVCIGNTLKTCSKWEDTMCNYEAACRRTQQMIMPLWLVDHPEIRCPKGQQIINMTGVTPICAQCPGHLWGPNGAWCEPCKGYKIAYWDNSICVCRSPTIPTVDETCICPEGYMFSQEGCLKCPINTYDKTQLVLGDLWWNYQKSCISCSLGTYSVEGQTSCMDCPKYTYRLSNHTTCQTCPPNSYALYPFSSLCWMCNSMCPKGYYSETCPTNPNNFICHQCANPPNNSKFVSMNNYTNEYICVWQCNTGFYRGINQCVQCSTGLSCEPGKVVAQCNDIQDVSCDWDCVNDTKPMFNSKWSKGCDWGCNTGYQLQVVDYGMWTQYECMLEGSLPFWTW